MQVVFVHFVQIFCRGGGGGSAPWQDPERYLMAVDQLAPVGKENPPGAVCLQHLPAVPGAGVHNLPQNGLRRYQAAGIVPAQQKAAGGGPAGCRKKRRIAGSYQKQPFHHLQQLLLG